MDKYYKSGEKVKGEYTIINEIAEGPYGIAYLADDDNKENVVVKQLKKNMLKETRKNFFMREKFCRVLIIPDSLNLLESLRTVIEKVIY